DAKAEGEGEFDEFFLGESSRSFFREVAKRAQHDDSDLVGKALTSRISPQLPEPPAGLSEQPILTTIGERTEQARAAFQLRTALNDMIDIIATNEQVDIAELKKKIPLSTKLDTVWYGISLNELRFTLRYLARTAKFGTLGPIESNKFMSS